MTSCIVSRRRVPQDLPKPLRLPLASVLQLSALLPPSWSRVALGNCWPSLLLSKTEPKRSATSPPTHVLPPHATRVIRGGSRCAAHPDASENIYDDRPDMTLPVKNMVHSDSVAPKRQKPFGLCDFSVCRNDPTPLPLSKCVVFSGFCAEEECHSRGKSSQKRKALAVTDSGGPC